MFRRRTASRRTPASGHRVASATALARAAGATLETLERRVLLNSAFDITGVTAMRNDPNFSFLTGQGIGIAVIDTGVFAQNPELKNNIVSFYNAVQQPPTAPIDTNFLQDAVDNEGHGSHVSGIAASTNPNIGIAYQAHLSNIKGLPDSGEVYNQFDPVLNGLIWVQRHHAEYNIKVVNLSLGTPGTNFNNTPALDAQGQAIHTLEGMGVTVVAASGNSYADFITPGESNPAAQATVGVGNSWPDDGLGTYNFTGVYGSGQFGSFENSAQPDVFAASSQRSTLFNQIVAPGQGILSTWNSLAQPHNTISGTSMASPLVAGAVALMQQAAFAFGGRYLTPEEVITTLHTSADHIVDANNPNNGRIDLTDPTLTRQNLPETGLTFDRINVYRAVQQVKQLVQGGGLAVDANRTIASAINVTPLNGANIVTFNGNIGFDGNNNIGFADVDVYKLVVQTPGTLTITSSSGPPGTIQVEEALRLFDSTGNTVLASAGGNGVSYPTLLSPPGVPLPAGTYYLGVSSAPNNTYSIINGSGTHTGGSRGDYQINVSVQTPDPGGVYFAATAVGLNAPSTLTPLFPGNSFPFTTLSGTIGQQTAPDGSLVNFTDGDVHFYSVVAPDTGTLTLQSDEHMEVFNSAATRIAAGDVTLNVPVTVGQIYYIGVTTSTNANFAPNNPFARVPNSTFPTPFSLYIGFDNGDKNGTVVTASPQTLGTPVNGTIGSDPTGTFLGANGGNKDVDFYSFTAPTAGIVKIVVAGNGGFAPQLSVWNSASGFDAVKRLANAQSNTLYEQVTAGQQVIVAVTGKGNNTFNGLVSTSGSGGTTGTYTVNTTLQPLSDLATLSNNSIVGSTPTPLTLGVTVPAQIGNDGDLVVGPQDVDMYQFTAPTSRRYRFGTTTDPESSADTVIRIFDALGNQVAVNDNIDATTTASAVSVSMLAGQTYYIGVSGAGSGALAYNPLNGNAAAPGSIGNYNVQVADVGPFQRSLTFQEGKKLTITDASGHKVTLNLTGPGTGEVVFLSTSGNDNIAQLNLTGTDGTSNLTVNGATPLGKVSVSTALGSFNARQASLTGDFTVGGGLGKLMLANASNGTITIGAGNALVATLGQVTDESLTSAETIKSLKVDQWSTTGATRFTISAPSIASLTAKGGFNEDVGTATLSRMSVGSLTASAIRASSAIGTVNAGTATGSLIFAGVQNTVTAMPTASSDFTGSQAIKSVNVRGTFSNTQIAAWNVGNINLRAVQGSNGGTPFGVAGNHVANVQATVDGKRTSNKGLFAPLAAVSLGGDAIIRILG